MTELFALEIGAGLGAVAGYCLSRFGYWLGRMHEYDFIKSQGWMNPTFRAEHANIYIDATDEQVADALIRESRGSSGSQT